MIRLITRADDAGCCESVNEAIVETIRSGIVRNVSVMANGLAVAHAASLLAGEKSACFGMHATLHAEWNPVRWRPLLPTEQVRSLVDEDGYLLPTPAAYIESPPVIEELMAELQAQLDHLRGLGFDIRYADTHMVFEWALPGFRETFSRWCEQEGIRNYMDYNEWPWLPEVGQHGQEDEDERQLDSGLRLAAEASPAERLIRQLSSLAPGQYTIVGHPGYDRPDLRLFGNAEISGEMVAAGRVAERLLFSAPEVLEACRQYGARPIRYDEATRVESH